MLEGQAPRVYANVINLAAGPYDVAITFGRMDSTMLPTPDEPAPAAVVPEFEPVVEVFMSWGHLKAMLPILTKTVADFEQQYGEIPAPGFDQFSKG